MTKDDTLKAIVDEIFAVKKPRIGPEKHEQISKLIITTINGDNIEEYVVIELTLNGKPGIFAYVLTNLRLIQFEVEENGEARSGSFILNAITGVERNIIDDGKRIAVGVNFDPGPVVGLRYANNNQKITEFFQKVEQAWIRLKGVR